jgi:hypothetical protein
VFLKTTTKFSYIWQRRVIQYVHRHVQLLFWSAVPFKVDGRVWKIGSGRDRPENEVLKEHEDRNRLLLVAESFHCADFSKNVPKIPHSAHETLVLSVHC